MSLGEVDDAEFQAWANRVRARISANEVKNELETSAKRIGVQALRQFKANTPVDTGTLRHSWNVEGPFYSGGWSIKLENNAEYASYVENGHRTRGGGSWVAGQFFMKKSAQQIESQLPDLITPGLWASRDLLE